MAVNLAPNAALANAKFAEWVPTAITVTAPTGTYSATGGPNALQPSLQLSATGSSGTVEAVYSIPTLAADASYLVLSAIIKASSATPTLVPFAVNFKDSGGNTLTATPIASAAAPTSYTLYSAVVGVPYGMVSAKVVLAALTWGSVGYTVTFSAPAVYVA